MKALSSSKVIGSKPTAQEQGRAQRSAPELSIDERLRRLEQAVMTPKQPEGYVDQHEYDRAIFALARGDKGRALDAYIKKGGRIPRNEN